MSTIDERIVSMQFNNGQFMKASSDTLSALEKLKQGVDFKGLGKGIGALDLSAISASVDQLRAKFEGLGGVVTGALLGIGNKMIEFGLNAGKKLGDSLVQGAKQGLSEYETQINGIQTIMSNTASKGTTMTEVNSALKELNTYADKTIYNFSEMTRNIGTFTAAGVDLKTSTAAIKGIANLAAMSGSNSQQASTAMYQLSQALASGKVSLMDWNSVVNAGMGGQVFQEELKRTARAQGIAIDDIIAKNGSFRESLQSGWLTAGVLTETLAKFTGDLTREQIISMGYTEQQADEILALGQNANDAATKVKTFSQLLETLNESVGSGWAQSWQIVLGDFEEAKKLFTEISDTLGGVIQESADARNAQLQIWKDGGGREALIQGMRNSFQALFKVIQPIRQAMAEVFPPQLGNTLLKLSFAIRDFTAGLIVSDAAAAAIKQGFVEFFTVLKVGLTIIGSVFRVIGNNIRIFFELGGAILGLIRPIVDFVASFIPVSEGAKDVSGNIVNLTDRIIEFQNFVSGPLIKILQDAGSELSNFLSTKAARKGAEEVIENVKGIGSAVASMYNILAKGDYTSNPLFSEDSAFASKLFDIRDAILDLASAAASAFNILFKGDYTGNPLFSEDSDFANALFNIREGIFAAVEAVGVFFGFVEQAGQRSIGFWAKVGDVLRKVIDGIKPVVDAVKKAVSQFMQGLDFNTILATLNTGFLLVMILAIRNFIKNISGIFEGAGKLGGGLIGALDGVTGVLKAMQLNLKAEALLKIAGAIAVLALAFIALSMVDPNRLMQASIAMGVIAGAVMGILLVIEKLMATSGAVDTWSDTLKGSFTEIGEAVKQNLQASAFVKAATGMLIMAAALLIMAAAITLLANLETGAMVQGLIGIAVALGLLVGAALLLDKMKNSIISASFSMIVMAVAITALAGAVAIFGSMPVDVLTQGMMAVAIVLTGLVLAAQQLSANAPKMLLSAVGLIAMAAALNMLILPITALGLLPLPVIAQGMMAVSLMLALLVVAATVLAPLGAPMALAALGLMAMAAAVGQLVLPITALGNMDLAVLVQGLIAVAAVLTILVVAANAMTGAMLGAGAMIFVAGALLILAVAIGILGAMPMGNLVQGLIAVAAALIIVGVAGYLLTGGIPGMLAAAAAFLVISIGMILISAAIMVFALAVSLLGPALMSVTAGILVFAGSADKIMAAVPAFLAVGAGLLVFGLGAAVAGAGILVLGLGIAVLGAALALMGAVGIIGATALAAVVVQIAKLVEHAVPITIMAGAFTLLGAGVLVLGAGLLVLAAGALLTALALTALVPLGGLVTIALNLVMAAIQKAADKAPAINALAAAMGPLGDAVGRVGSSGAAAAGGIMNASAAFVIMAAAAIVVGTSVAAMAVMFMATLPPALRAVTTSGQLFVAFVAVMLAAVMAFQVGVSSAVPVVVAGAMAMARGLTTTVINAVRSSQGEMSSAGYTVGMEITNGMRRGIQNGSSGVSAAARQVANQAMAASRAALEIRSPSRKYAEMGMYMDKGLAGGQLKHAGVVTNASTRVAEAAVQATRDVLSRLKNDVATDMDLSPTVKPVLDLTNWNPKDLALGDIQAATALRLDNTRAMANQAYQVIESNREEQNEQESEASRGETTVNLTLNTYSPKAISPAEQYRSGNSLIAKARKVGTP